MSLSANQCFKKGVLAKDKTLGIFVNLVFDRESREARMLIFPGLKTGKRLDEAARSLGSLGRSALSTVSYDLYDVAGPASGLVTDVTYEGVRQAQDKIYRKRQEKAALFYLLPVSEISNLEKDKIQLEMDSEEYEFFKNMKGTRSDVAFFNDELLREPERLVGISLNLTSIRGLSVKDKESTKGRILDIIFDPIQGVVTHIIVKTIGKGAKSRFVDLTSVDFMEMTISKIFKEYPVNLTRS
jgi:hypothetical protein